MCDGYCGQTLAWAVSSTLKGAGIGAEIRGGQAST